MGPYVPSWRRKRLTIRLATSSTELMNGPLCTSKDRLPREKPPAVRSTQLSISISSAAGQAANKPLSTRATRLSATCGPAAFRPPITQGLALSLENAKSPQKGNPSPEGFIFGKSLSYRIERQQIPYAWKTQASHKNKYSKKAGVSI